MVILNLLLIIKLALTFRLEPKELYDIREKFYLDSINKFSNSLILNKSFDKGYYCISSKHINKNDEILRINKNFTYSVLDYFPLKNMIINYLEELNTYNMTQNILLTSRIMYDLKANKTNTYILMKKYDNQTFNLNNLKSYINSMNKFLLQYINTLPLSNNIGFTSWSQEEIEEYMITGFLPVIKSKLENIYDYLVYKFKSNEILFQFTNDWFNNANKNLFLSIYGFINTRSFKIENNEVILIPFIDLCNHYHPRIINDKLYSKKIKVSFDNNYVSIRSLSEYEKGEEFAFTYSDVFTNDYFVLNYGFIIDNNQMHEFVFRFDIEDPGFKFLRKLQLNGFDTTYIRLDSDKLVIHFSLQKRSISESLYEFIRIYLSFYNNKEDKMKINALYYNTIQKNIKTLFTNNIYNNTESMIDTYMNNINKIKETSKRINEEEENINNYKLIHSSLKKDLILKFNIENLKILESQKNLILIKMLKSFNKNLSIMKSKLI